jgi:hypothetical protein
MSNLSDEQTELMRKREKERLMANARARKYYEKNKQKVKTNVQQRRAREKAEYNNIITAQAIANVDVDVLDENNNDDNDDDHYDESEPAVPVPVAVRNNGPTPKFDVKYSLSLLKKGLEESLKNPETSRLKSGTYTKYYNDIKSVFDATKCTDLMICVKNPEKMIKQINKQKKPNGEPYANNSLRAYVSALIVVLEQYMKPYLTKAVYSKALKILNTEKKKRNAQTDLDKIEQQKNVKHIDFKEYVKKIKQKYKTTSKQYLLAKLYERFTCRDDYAGMFIIDDKDEDNKKDNYMLKTRMGYKIILNSYKTSVYDEAAVMNFPSNKKENEELISLLNDWTKKKKSGAYLFGKSKLSHFLKKMNEGIGLDFSVNGIRQMRVTSTINNMKKKITMEERGELSRNMLHGIATQLKYQMGYQA